MGHLRGHSKSLAMSPFDRALTTSYSTLTVTTSRQEWQNILSAVLVDFDISALAHFLRGKACLAI